MATSEDCQGAIETLVGRLSDVDPNVKKGKLPDRSIAVHILDLDVTFLGDLADGEITNVRIASGDPKSKIRIVCTSDDLLAMTEGELNFARAWASGRVRLDASIRDLLRLRNLSG